MAARPVHFEIHATDPERAIAFYTRLFGWSFHRYEGSPTPYWLITTGPDEVPGINGGLMARNVPAEGVRATTAFVCTLGVDDLDALLAELDAAGGTLEFPKSPIPRMGWLAYARDTEGNLFGMMQMDPDAPAPGR